MLLWLFAYSSSFTLFEIAIEVAAAAEGNDAVDPLRLLLALLTLWGLTGIKSLLFHVYEDLILLLCGLYGVRQLLLERRRS